MSLGNKVLDIDILGKFVELNLKQLDILSSGNLDEDIEKIQYMTKLKFVGSIELMSELSHSEIYHPRILPNIKNILNEKDEKVSLNVTRDIKLYLPQATMLHRMLEIENFDNIHEIGKSEENDGKGENRILQSNLCIISERFSFGKTFMIPILFKLQPVPKFVENSEAMSLYITPEDIIHVNTNLVVCANKTVKVWTENLKKLGLKYQKVSTIKDFSLLDLDNLPEVIIVKDGFTTYLGEKKHTLDHFNELTRELYFNRLIIDDYDMLKLNSESKLPYAKFVWLLSSTCESNFKPNKIKGTLGYIQQIHPIINFYFNLRCNSDYSAVEFNMPNIDYYYTQLEMEELVLNIMMNSAPVDNKYNDIDDVFLKTKIDIPYLYNPNNIKILISCENKEKRRELVNKIPNSILFDGRNIHKFNELPNQVGICGLVHGVNLGYLTHVLIDSSDYTFAKINQIVGRAQRIGRTQNLQVYIK